MYEFIEYEPPKANCFGHACNRLGVEGFMNKASELLSRVSIPLYDDEVEVSLHYKVAHSEAALAHAKQLSDILGQGEIAESPQDNWPRFTSGKWKCRRVSDELVKWFKDKRSEMNQDKWVGINWGRVFHISRSDGSSEELEQYRTYDSEDRKMVYSSVSFMIDVGLLVQPRFVFPFVEYGEECRKVTARIEAVGLIKMNLKHLRKFTVNGRKVRVRRVLL